MDLKCLKCNNNFETDISNVYATTCGHIFHSKCLMQWIERFDTCPHCSQRQTKQEVIKLYFGLTDLPQKNSQELRNKIYSLSDELQQKDDNIRSLKDQILKCKINKKELREELSKLKKKMSIKKGAIQFNLMAIDYHARICKVKEKYKTEAFRLRQQLCVLQGMNEIINASSNEIDDILLRSTLDKAGLTLCVDTLVEKLQESDQYNEKLDEDLVCYQNNLLYMEEELDSLKEEYSVLFEEIQGDEEGDCDELTKLRWNICNLIKNCRLEYLLIAFPDLESSTEKEDIDGTSSEISTNPRPSQTTTEPTSPDITKEMYCPPLDLALKKKCKDLVKNACKNPMQYLKSGKVELLDSDDDTETGTTMKTEEKNLGFYCSSKLNNKFDHKKYRKLVKKKHLTADTGAIKKPMTSDVNKKMSYYSVLELMASAKKKT